MKKQFRFGIFPKAALLIVGLATIPMAVVGLQILRLNKGSLQYEVLRYHSHMAQTIADKLNSHLADLDEELRFVVTSLKSEELSWPEKQSILQAKVDSHQHFAQIAIVTQDGNEFIKVYNPVREAALAAFPTLLSHAEDPLFKQFLGSQERVLEILPDAEDPRLRLYYPFETPTGRHAIFINTSLDNFWKEIKGTKIGRSGYCFLVDKDGFILAHPDRAKTEAKTPARSMPIVLSALAGNNGASEFLVDATPSVGAAAPIHRMGGAVVTVQPRAEAFDAARKGQKTALLWLALSAFIAAVIAYVFARRLARPILALISAAHEVNLEEARFPEPVTVQTRDELGELSETFNLMTQRLESYTALQVERLMAEKTKTESIVFSINDGLIMTDHQGIIEFINNRARQILDISVDHNSLLKKPLLDFLPHTEVMDVLWDIIHHSEEESVREVDMSATGFRRVFKVYSNLVRSTNRGEDIGIVIIFHDVTLEKEIEQMKEDFLHSITHDLRNPMSSIRGFLKFILDGMGGPITDQQRKMLETMDRASLRLLGMINDILDTAKAESGKMELNLADTDLKEVARHVLELLQSQALKKKIQLVVDAPAGLPVIQADPLLMERLFTNLTGNAIKFTPESGRITVELRDGPDRISGAVVDTGEGIPAEFLDKIFDKFQQVTGQRKGGTGLGLTICKYIVEGHKGEIGVESEMGKGSRFHFWVSKGLTPTPAGGATNGHAADSPATAENQKAV
ncbi:MAG: HAMP domain-containing protein [Elusimicrobia bacterium]|nr:HAMP domain-containing protein [Elusimicrobiota bacterium]